MVFGFGDVFAVFHPHAAGLLQSLKELAPTGWKQLELVQSCFDENGLVKDSDVLGWCFVAWVTWIDNPAGFMRRFNAQAFFLQINNICVIIFQLSEKEVR